MDEHQEQKRIGKSMLIGMWVLLLGLLTLLFGELLEKQYNPNQQLSSQQNQSGKSEVVLQRNKFGHYVANGKINGEEVTFMLDTGATDISIPEPIALRLGLERGRSAVYQTAKGPATVYTTQLDHVSLGNIQLQKVRATINPHMNGEEILLGMSFLKHLDFEQKGNTLTLKQSYYQN
ncbi:MAG: TIGR02281 family clan AA aspartic protease [Gammaproteobacteria bacterium]|nr:TIGR02281 family clan AA aspartic protease [Gammaproteobacteria bacterium]